VQLQQLSTNLRRLVICHLSFNMYIASMQSKGAMVPSMPHPLAMLGAAMADEAEDVPWEMEKARGSKNVHVCMFVCLYVRVCVRLCVVACA
jgi:hypothetical protein